MKEPCRSCEETDTALGGCHCQAITLTGDMYTADPVWAKSEHHHLIEEERERAEAVDNNPDEFTFRNERNSKVFAKS
jgi:pyrroloquinoline quinone biosynthesis protein E